MEKLKNLILYIVSKTIQNPKKFGKVKLNKVLYYSDREFYSKHLKTITGVQYIKKQMGPVPQNIEAVLNEMVNDKAIHIKEIFTQRGNQFLFFNLLEPELEKFTSEEIAIVDNVFEEIYFRETAYSISEKTHDEIWKMALINEIIPMNTIFATGDDINDITDEDIQWAKDNLSRVLSNAV